MYDSFESAVNRRNPILHQLLENALLSAILANKDTYVALIMGYGKINQFLLGVPKQALKDHMRRAIQANSFLDYDMVHLYRTLITERVIIRFAKNSDQAEREETRLGGELSQSSREKKPKSP